MGAVPDRGQLEVPDQVRDCGARGGEGVTKSVDAMLARARALARAGRSEDAAQMYRAILARFPANARARDGLAGLPGSGGAEAVRALLRAGKPDAALVRLEPLIAADPESAGLRVLAGGALARLGFHERALAQYARALALDPGHDAAAFGAANMLYLLGRFDEAAEKFAQVLAAAPEHADARNNLGLSLHRLGRLAEARQLFEDAVRRQPDQARLWFNLGNVQADEGRPQDAIASYRRSLELAPQAAETLNNLGNVLRGVGRIDEARAAYRRALEAKPDHAASHLNLADLHRFAAGEPWIAELRDRLAAAGDDADRVHYGFALAKALDDTGDTDGAFAALAEANRLRRRQLGHDPAADRRQFEAVKRMFRGPLPETAGDPAFRGGPQPIFIVGMMRSGTSLVEKILASHSRVFGAGELEFMGRLAIPRARAAEADPALRIDRDMALAVRQGYLAALAALPEQAPVITDKMPTNLTWVGFILTAFPEAKVIHLNRDPMAVGWSIFRHYFSQDGNGYSYDLADIGHYYRLQQDLMAFWQQAFPGRILDLNYEALTEDQEGQTRALLDWCGLAWEDACLNFHETPGLVRTASSAQVRRAMYRGSSDEWRRYAAHLGPLRDALAGVI
jgi:tetratricopeptide (TPR) repeat protein